MDFNLCMAWFDYIQLLESNASLGSTRDLRAIAKCTSTSMEDRYTSIYSLIMLFMKS